MNKIFSIISFLIVPFLATTQGDWPVTIANVGTLDGRVENFVDLVQATVTNPTGTTTPCNFLLSIERADVGLNISNESFYQDFTFDVNPGLNMYTIRQVINQFAGTNLEDFDYGSAPPGYEDYVREQRRLPPGQYRSCLTVYEEETGIQRGSSCFDFQISARNAPIIQNPPDLPDGAWIPGTDEVFFTVGWFHPEVIGEEYTVEIKRFADFDAYRSFNRNDHAAFDALAPAIIPVEDIEGYVYNVTGDDVVQLEVGDFIAIRVTANATIGQYLNQGRSNIVIAAYGVTGSLVCEHPSFISHVVWPNPGDTLPFRNIHYVVEFDPLCDNLREFEATFETSDRTGTTFRRTTHHDRWRVNGGGAYNYLEHFASLHSAYPLSWVLPDSSYAQNIPLVHTSAASSVFNPVTPNQEGYRMSANLTYTYYDYATRDERTQTQNLTEFIGQSYHVGMPKPNLISPANNDTIQPGDITFRFNTGNRPSEPLPPFQIMKIDASGVTNPYLNVQEKMVLQIANDSTFTPTSIIHDGLRTIQASSAHPEVTMDWNSPSFTSLPLDEPIDVSIPDRTYREEDFLSQVYKSGDMTFNFATEDTVWWRVVWLRTPENFNDPSPRLAGAPLLESQIYNVSSVRKLIIADGGTPPPPPPEEEEDRDCAAECTIPAPTVTTPLESLAVGEKFNAGQFEVTVTTVSGSGGNFTGTGTVLIPFLNNLKLMARFSGARINSERKLVSGHLDAIDDPNPFTINTQPGSELPYIDSTDVVAFNDWMNEAGRLYSFMSGEPIGLPVGIDKEIDGRQVIVAITEAKFLPTTSNLKFVAGFEIPEISTHISLGIKDVCMHPGGFGADSVTMYLPYDMGFDFQGTAMHMKGGDMSTPLDEICYATFDCNGFKRAKLAFECKFPRSAILPDAGGIPSTDSTERVSFTASARYDFNHGVMLRFNMDPFYINGSEDFRFRVEEAYVDLSSAVNPPSINFPENYRHDSMDSTGMANSWEGFYLKRLTLEFPDDLITSSDPGVGVYDFIFDGKWSFKVGAYNVIDDGTIGDWKATLDTIQFVMTQSEPDEFELNGRLEPPLAAAGEWLNYRAVLDFEADNNYYLQVDVEDSLRVPMVVANMTLNGDSYVRVGRNDTRGAYIRANFSGRITIDDEYVPDGISDIPGMSMPYISFQELVMDSDTGIRCRNWDFAGITGSGGPGGGLAPPPIFASEDGDQGFAAGFPISIDSMGLGGGLENPTLHIKASLNFQSGENGISAGCALNFVGRFDDSGGGQKLHLDRVDLSGIYIEAEFSAVSLKGSLEWEKTDVKEEIRGALAVKIPTGIEVNIAAIFGTYKAYESAPFDTEDHYNYWMVDGSVKFGEGGVPICSGIALFGLGGGVWHHMEMDESKLMSPRATLSSSDSNTRVSNTARQKYSNDFNTLLGLRFNVVLGIQNSSSTVNLEVGIIAEFTESHGLSRLQINGAVYVMQQMGTGQGGDEGGMLYGQAVLEYRNNAVSGKTFTGEIDVWLNVANIVKGAVDDNDKLADVNFYADEEEWYFHMGNYDTSTGVINPGAAIKLTLGDTELLKASSYIMVGYRVPLELPLPPENVRDLLGMDTQASGDNELSANDPPTPTTADYLTGVRTEDGSFATGEGFAFGTTMNATLGIDAFIYFTLGLTVGFDVNLTEQNYNCLGYGKPGIDGWYAQGQAYVALEGEMGIKFKFFGERKIELLYLGVAMMLEAKLVNPNYFKGSAGVRFSVLGGAFEGRKTMKVELGEQCQPMIDDPLANLDFIDKIEPNSTMRNVSVFATPSVFFNFAMNRSMFLPQAINPETGLPSAFYNFIPFVSEFKVTRLDTREELVGNDIFTPDQKIIQRNAENALEGYTTYGIYCKVKIRDYTAGAIHSIYRDSTGIEWAERKRAYFTTGAYPEIIPESNVKYTYPVQNQRFFLQNETNKKGTVCLFRGMGSSTGAGGGLFYPSQGGLNYEYALRITKATDFEDTRDVPINYSSGNYIPFTLPLLENEEMYIAQIVRKIQGSTSTGNSLIMAPVGINESVGGPRLLSEVIRRRLTQSVLGYSDLVVERLTPESLIKGGESKLLQWYFRTSKYNSLRSKLNASDTEGRTPSVAPVSYYTNVADVEVVLEEGFDEFDLRGYYRNGVRVINPMVTFTDPLISDYWTKHGVKNTFIAIRNINGLRSINVKYRSFGVLRSGRYNISGSWPNSYYSYPITYQSGKWRSYYTTAEDNAYYPRIDEYAINTAIAQNGDSGGLPESILSTMSETDYSNTSLPMGVTPGMFENIFQSHFGGPPADDFFNPKFKKLLLHYDLSKQSYLKLRDTKTKIYSFYNLKYNVPVKSGYITRRVNLTKRISEFMRDDRNPYDATTRIILGKYYWGVNYVTNSYTKYSEFGNQYVQNRYHIRYRFKSPVLSPGLYLVHYPTTRSYLMTKDLDRIAAEGPF